MTGDIIRLLYVSSNEQDAKAMEGHLSKFEGARFDVVWKGESTSALEFFEHGSTVDVIIVEDVLLDISGVEFARRVMDKRFDIPMVFLSTSKDINLAVEVMRLGAKDYFLKEDIGSRLLPQSLLQIMEKQRLKQKLTELEIRKNRLEVMQKIVVDISDRIKEPLDQMRKIIDSLEQGNYPEKATMYLKLIKENVERMQLKLEKLGNLKEDKTVKYIRDIKMIDLS